METSELLTPTRIQIPGATHSLPCLVLGADSKNTFWLVVPLEDTTVVHNEHPRIHDYHTATSLPVVLALHEWLRDASDNTIDHDPATWPSVMHEVVHNKDTEAGKYYSELLSAYLIPNPAVRQKTVAGLLTNFAQITNIQRFADPLRSASETERNLLKRISVLEADLQREFNRNAKLCKTMRALIQAVERSQDTPARSISRFSVSTALGEALLKAKVHSRG